MKKLVLLFSVLFLMSCSNEDIIDSDTLDKSTIESAPLEKQIAYAEKHLLDIGKIISKLYTKKEFRNSLFTKMESKNNQELESRILMKDLLIDLNKNSSILSLKDKQNLDASLKAFYNLDNQDWHVDLFIPFIDKQLAKYQNKSMDPNKPVIVLSVEEIPDPKGYQEDENGQLSLLDERITLDVANNIINTGRALLVIGIGDGNDDYDDPWSGGNSGSTTNYPDYLRLGRMKVKQNKEAWVSGKSEIHVRGFWDDESNQYGAFFSQHNASEYGSQMKQFRRRWISNGDTKTLNFSLLHDWDNVDAIGIDQFFVYTIFEYDGWPARTKIATLPPLPSGIVRTIEYRSNQYLYSKDVVSLAGYYYDNIDQANGHTVNNSGIQYNFYRDTN